MPRLRVQIVRFIEAYQPGIVECQFRDAEGQVHSIIGKLPYFTEANLWFDSDYPQPGEVDCTDTTCSSPVKLQKYDPPQPCVGAGKAVIS
jgi:hypothetical protein